MTKTYQGSNLWGEKKKRSSLSSASDVFLTARLSSPVWSGSILLLLRSFFSPCFLSLLFLYISPLQNRSQGSTVLIHWLLLGGDALDQVIGLCSGLTRKKHWKGTRESTPPHLPVPWNGWGIWNAACEQREGPGGIVSTSCLALTR